MIDDVRHPVQGGVGAARDASTDRSIERSRNAPSRVSGRCLTQRGQSCGGGFVVAGSAYDVAVIFPLDDPIDEESDDDSAP